MSDTMSAPVSTGSESTGSEVSESAAVNESQAAPEAEGQEAQSKPAQTASSKKKFKYKVDGEDVEEEIDLSDEENLVKRLRASRAVDKRMSEAKTLKGQALEIIKAFENGDESFFERQGPKARELAEKILLKHIQAEMETPEQKAQRLKDEKLKKYEESEAKQNADAEAKALEAKTNKYAQEFQATIIGALEKSGLPKSPVAVKRMAALLDKNMKLGLDLTAAELAAEYKTEVLETIKALAGSADGDTLISLLGEDTANKIRKSDLKKLQEKHSQLFSPKQNQGSGSFTPKEDKPMSMDEWKEQLAQRYK